jgi:hypothetical protein
MNREIAINFRLKINATLLAAWRRAGLHDRRASFVKIGPMP